MPDPVAGILIFFVRLISTIGNLPLSQPLFNLFPRQTEQRTDPVSVNRTNPAPGAFIGGILLGLIEIFSKAYISSQMADAIVFAVLIVVLLVKPTGLLGKQIQEKV
mgnify:CR=1 FL=1